MPLTAEHRHRHGMSFVFLQLTFTRMKTHVILESQINGLNTVLLIKIQGFEKTGYLPEVGCVVVVVGVVVAVVVGVVVVVVVGVVELLCVDLL